MIMKGGLKWVENHHLRISLENISKVMKIMRATINFLRHEGKTKSYRRRLDFGTQN